MIHDGSGKLEKLNHQEEANSQTFVMGSDAAEFVNKVKDQVRSRQKRMSNVAESGEEHSIIWGMFMAATLNAATFMGKNFSTIQSFVKNFEDLTLKQMFDVTAQLVNDQEEIHGLDKIQWEKNSGKRLSLIGDETVINLQSTKVYVFSDSELFLGKIHQHPNANESWKERIEWIDFHEEVCLGWKGVRSPLGAPQNRTVRAGRSPKSTSVYPSENGRCSQILENSQI